MEKLIEQIKSMTKVELIDAIIQESETKATAKSLSDKIEISTIINQMKNELLSR